MKTILIIKKNENSNQNRRTTGQFGPSKHFFYVLGMAYCYPLLYIIMEISWIMIKPPNYKGQN